VTFVDGDYCDIMISMGNQESRSLTIGFEGLEDWEDRKMARATETQRPNTTIENTWLTWKGRGCAGALGNLERREYGDGFDVSGVTIVFNSESSELLRGVKSGDLVSNWVRDW